MAGIGFELRKIFEKETIYDKIRGSIFAAITSIGPTVIVMLLLVFINFIMDNLNVPEKEQIFFSSACLYIFVIATIISGVLNTISTRFTSDMIFQEKEEYIPSAMLGTLFISGVAASILVSLICIQLYTKYNITIGFLVGYYAMGVMISITYSIMSFISAIKEYGKITGSFLIGCLSVALCFFVLYKIFEQNVLNSIIFSMALGFFLINILLIYYIITFFGKTNNEYFAFTKYYKLYPLLFLSGLFYILGLYIPNIIYWFLSGISVQVTVFHVTPTYDMATFMAILINLSSMVIFTVKVETAFYEKYKVYLGALNTETYATIEKARKIMVDSISINLFYIYEIQLIITILLTCLAVLFLPMLGMGGFILDFFLLLGIAVYCIFSMYYTVIFLYYFSDIIGSCITTGIFFTITIIASIIAVKLGTGYYAAAPLLGAIIAWIFGFVRLKYILKEINANLFCRELG